MMHPITISVTVITATDARDTVPLRQKLKKPVRLTLLTFVMKRSFVILDNVLTLFVVSHNPTLVHSDYASTK